VSGLTEFRITLVVGALLLLGGVAYFSAPVAAGLAGVMLIVYAVVVVDVARPGRKQRKVEKRERDEHTYVTTARR
jgi:hypothetical protein